ncbi:hypothetical protein F4X33_09750, partial [Candidatus Poribacteria bacterium]|nr:hypothetical protein [Candidatus Poribacteria bacterium]
MQTLTTEEQDKIRQVIWEAVLDADLNLRYWDHLSRRYSAWDKYTKIFLAIMSSSTVASWGIWDEIDLLWKCLSAVSAGTAIALPILDWQRKIGEMSNLKGKWSRISRAYENLWEDLLLGPTNTELVEEYRRIRNEMEGEEDNTSPD